ncbi:uncharacterized protein LOC119768704 [Culex quinquefasciatus]|uniref:uncharacterized protein LOC119768704 n=1 Tax=Culex quinquefasciatus TaxID=7176 RepID=UPI0018E2A6DB|nr:uncharacterized protein LOC119768704 [Culex quinquefasciatus]XP_039431071.1 uncharacterized protein LOC120414111 [Culex pipiens pallens]
MAELKKYIEREFLRIRAQQEIVQNQVQECLAHHRTARDFQMEMKNEISAIRQELAHLKKIPENRVFPVGSVEDLDQVRRKFRSHDTKEKLVGEIEYVLERVSKDKWLKKLIRDEVVQEFRDAKTIRDMNFIQYVIRNITQTSETAFTAMVSAAKSRLYSARYRKGQKENRKRPAKKPRRVLEDSENEEDDETEGEDGNKDIPSPAFSPLKQIR